MQGTTGTGLAWKLMMHVIIDSTRKISKSSQVLRRRLSFVFILQPCGHYLKYRSPGVGDEPGEFDRIPE